MSNKFDKAIYCAFCGKLREEHEDAYSAESCRKLTAQTTSPMDNCTYCGRPYKNHTDETKQSCHDLMKLMREANDPIHAVRTLRRELKCPEYMKITDHVRQLKKERDELLEALQPFAKLIQRLK